MKTRLTRKRRNKAKTKKGGTLFNRKKKITPSDLTESHFNLKKPNCDIFGCVYFLRDRFKVEEKYGDVILRIFCTDKEKKQYNKQKKIYNEVVEYVRKHNKNNNDEDKKTQNLLEYIPTVHKMKDDVSILNKVICPIMIQEHVKENLNFGELNETELRQCFKKLLTYLKHAEDAGIVHGNLGPSTIILKYDDNKNIGIKFRDFTKVKNIGDDTADYNGWYHYIDPYVHDQKRNEFLIVYDFFAILMTFINIEYLEEYKKVDPNQWFNKFSSSSYRTSDQLTTLKNMHKNLSEKLSKSHNATDIFKKNCCATLISYYLQEFTNVTFRTLLQGNIDDFVNKMFSEHSIRHYDNEHTSTSKNGSAFENDTKIEREKDLRIEDLQEDYLYNNIDLFKGEKEIPEEYKLKVKESEGLTLSDTVLKI